MTPSLDVKEKVGLKPEVKILETKNKSRILKQLLLIRRLLDLDTSSKGIISVQDERSSSIWADGDNKIWNKKKN